MTTAPKASRPAGIAYPTRLFLLFLSEICLVLGGLFYVNPGISISLWPWPVKLLAVRFLGAIFLAIAFGCWAALRAGQWQKAKVLLLVGGTFFGIISLVTLDQIFFGNPPSFIWAWTVFFLAATSGCFNLLWKHGWYRKPADRPRNPTPSPLLARVFFRAQTVIVGVFGTMMLLFPVISQQQFWPWHVAVPTLQAFAGLFLATCLATGWASIQKDLQRIRVLLPLDMVFPTLALLAVGIDWNTIETESPSVLVSGVWVFVYSFVAVGSTILFVSTRKPDFKK